MTKMTSAYANKMLRKLSEDKEFYRRKEAEGCTYVAILEEEPVIPEYDYVKTATCIEEIDEKIVKIKHAINLANLTNEIEVDGSRMTADQILIRMAQLNKRKSVLDMMRKMEPQSRVGTVNYSTRRPVPEYRYINYDLDTVKADYDRIDAQLYQMQLALDKYNQTVEFEVEL